MEYYTIKMDIINYYLLPNSTALEQETKVKLQCLSNKEKKEQICTQGLIIFRLQHV